MQFFQFNRTAFFSLGQVVHEKSSIVFEGNFCLRVFEKDLHSFFSQFFFHYNTEIHMVNGPASGTFWVTGNWSFWMHLDSSGLERKAYSWQKVCKHRLSLRFFCRVAICHVYVLDKIQPSSYSVFLLSATRGLPRQDSVANRILRRREFTVPKVLWSVAGNP